MNAPTESTPQPGDRSKSVKDAQDKAAQPLTPASPIVDPGKPIAPPGRGGDVPRPGTETDSGG